MLHLLFSKYLETALVGTFQMKVITELEKWEPPELRCPPPYSVPNMTTTMLFQGKWGRSHREKDQKGSITKC